MTQPEPAQGQGDSAGDGDYRQEAGGDAGSEAAVPDVPASDVPASDVPVSDVAASGVTASEAAARETGKPDAGLPEAAFSDADFPGAGIPEQDSPRLTVAAVARRMGIAPATLRTWDRRYGLGPSAHSAGRHRRYGPEDIARLERMQRALLRGASPAEAARYAQSSESPQGDQNALVVPRSTDPATKEPRLLSGALGASGEQTAEIGTTSNTGGRGLRLTGAGPRTRGLGRAVLALDSWSVQELLWESIETDGIVAVWCDVLQPVLGALRERRQRSGSGIEAQQLLVDCAATVLRTVIATAPSPVNPRPVLLAAVPGESQGLDLVALAAALAVNGVGHRLFGGVLPKEGLDAAVKRAAPAAVVLWAEQPHYAAPQLLAEIPNTRQRARVFAAGPGWGADPLPVHAEHLGSLERAVARISETLLS